METSVDTQSIAQSKESILQKLTKETQGRKNMLLASSEHFAVVYKDVPDIYKHFGSWLDTDPSSMTIFLEGLLPGALKHFRIPTPTTFQVLEVTTGGFLHGGKHKGASSQSPSERENFPGIGLNWAYAKDFDHTTKKPNIYGVAIHEAIGHGIVNTALFGPESKVRQIQFLEEGLATYIENFLLKRSSHDMLQHEMFFDALWIFPELRTGEIDSLSLEEVKNRLKKTPVLSNISPKDCFQLQSDSMDVLKIPLLSYKAQLPGYYRGASFVQFLIESYGIDTFKIWSQQVSPEDFYEKLESVFGKSLDELESEWKSVVLQHNFTQNPLLTDVKIGKEEKSKQELLTRVTDFYNKYA